MQTGNNSSDFLDTLKCPITYELFCEPVIGSDGHTYERENIIAWIQKHATSPITREPMNLNSLRPNYIVKKMVQDFISLSLKKQYEFHLDIDVSKAKQRPIFQTPNKTIYEGKWLFNNGPPIVLIEINGTKAKHEASFYVKLSCHPHIVRTYGLVNNNSSDSTMLVQEYAPEGDLSELLRNNNFQPTIEVLIEIFCQIVDAMICLADNQIIHGDLACRNVLVFRSNPTQSTEILVKLTDFGLTRTSSIFSVIDTPASCTAPIIPIRSVAPELLLHTSSTNYTEKSDVYSFGVLMWEACSNGAVPYGYLKTTDRVYQERLKGRTLLEQPNRCSNELWNIILYCTQQEAHKRPNFKNIQEALLRLRFQNKQEFINKTSLIKIAPIPDKTRRKTFPTNNLPQKTNNHNSSGEYVFLSSTNSNKSLCKYCLQSLNTDELHMHSKICNIRRAVEIVVKAVVKSPLLEITLCRYCECIIPLNMFNIHQHICDRKSNSLHNIYRISQQTLPDSYVDSTYLKPISLPRSHNEETIYEYATMPDEQIKNPPLAFDKQFDISDQSSSQHTSTDNKTNKPPKTGLRKTFSKWKKKMS